MEEFDDLPVRERESRQHESDISVKYAYYKCRVFRVDLARSTDAGLTLFAASSVDPRDHARNLSESEAFPGASEPTTFALNDS
jgi:hypothetical protein